MSEEIKKVVDKHQELKEEQLDQVSGGNDEQFDPTGLTPEEFHTIYGFPMPQ